MVADPMKEFQTLLNRHGHGFAYAVISAVKQTPKGWGFEVSEFPAEVQGKGTRIDFILRYRDSNIFMVAECKRANPATSNWCFTKATRASQRREGFLRMVVLEQIGQTEEGGPYRRLAFNGWDSDRIYHVAREVKTGNKGEAGGKSTDEIENAVTQVLRGTNGLSEWVARHLRVLNDPDRSARFVPVIFTTAHLFTADVDLGATDIRTGNVDLSQHGLKPVDWVHYQYYQSPGLLNTLESAQTPGTFIDALHCDYARTIAVVSPSRLRAPRQRYFAQRKHLLE